MLRYTTDRARPGLVALYDIRPGNGAGQLLQPRNPHAAQGVKTVCVHTLSVEICPTRNSQPQEAATALIQPVKISHQQSQNAENSPAKTAKSSSSQSSVLLTAPLFMLLSTAETRQKLSEYQ